MRGLSRAGEGRASRGEAMTALASPKRARKRGKLPRLVASPRQAREDKQGVELGNANGTDIEVDRLHLATMGRKQKKEAKGAPFQPYRPDIGRHRDSHGRGAVFYLAVES